MGSSHRVFDIQDMGNEISGVPIDDLSVEEVAEYLAQIGGAYAQYRERFIAFGISGRDLTKLIDYNTIQSIEQLLVQEIQITNYVHCIRIMCDVKTIKKKRGGVIDEYKRIKENYEWKSCEGIL